jgi:hypothetical protein
VSRPKQNLVAELVAAARGGDREAGRGLLWLIRDRQLSGKPLDAEIHDWLADGVRLYLTGEARTLDDALGLVPPAHRESTENFQHRDRRVCELMRDLLTEWERKTARGELRYLSERQAIAILAAISARKPKLRETLAGILKRCEPKRRRELLDYLLKPPARPAWAGLRTTHTVTLPAFCDGVPRGLSGPNIKRIWSAHRAIYAPDA